MQPLKEYSVNKENVQYLKHYCNSCSKQNAKTYSCQYIKIRPIDSSNIALKQLRIEKLNFKSMG